MQLASMSYYHLGPIEFFELDGDWLDWMRNQHYLGQWLDFELFDVKSSIGTACSASDHLEVTVSKYHDFFCHIFLSSTHFQ